MPAPIVDISHLRLVVHQRPVVSASAELARCWDGDLDELRDCLLEQFAPAGGYREVGGDLHTVTLGSAETRLRSGPDGASWQADLFHAGWLNSPYKGVPADYRRQVAAYVDRAHELDEGCLQESDLREAAGAGGAPAVERLVRCHRDVLDQHYAALDTLIGDLVAPDGRLFPWAWGLVHDEVQTHHMRREWLGSAAIGYLCGGSAGQRPDTLIGGIRYDFRAGSVDLARPAPVEPKEDAVKV
ncbi:hypothetical protein ACIQPP_51055 [Streptomyces violaceusniger]|uniref:hypothetical protein n=1 Tax=Streptomyces violaceusniger TaxID=68280 RepID=UPI000998B991|nr:hypothetical protein [Streptomyces hygroscopicus]AQW48275.1 hypothetical protein SHXM_01738 [Streptomyces hygroscopicus]